MKKHPDRGGMDKRGTMRPILSSALFVFPLCSIQHITMRERVEMKFRAKLIDWAPVGEID
jgi:hypothetical protein